MAIPTVPGVSIEETEPPAPIRGVSTSIPAFIGMCGDGPTGKPTFVGSLDAFTATFGGPVDGGGTPFYLPLAVEGFFRNGGAQCFVLRAGSASPAFAKLPLASEANRFAGRAVALSHGERGRGGSVRITHTSALKAALGAGATGLPLLRDTAGITGADATRRKLTVDDAGTFAAGDSVVVTKGTDKTTGVIAARPAPEVLELVAALPFDPAGGTVETAPPGAGTTVLRLSVPASLSLRARVPRGSVVVLSAANVEEWAVVASTSAEGVTLGKPLTRSFPGDAKLVTAEFDATVTGPGAEPVTYRNLSPTPTHPRWWGGPAVDSGYLRFEPEDDLASATGDPRPKEGTYTLGAGSADDPVDTWARLNTGELMGDLLERLEPIDEIALVAAPGCSKEAQLMVVEHCEKLHDRFAILDSEAAANKNLDAVLQHRQAVTGKANKGFAALYYPWIQVRDPARNRVVAQPPSGHVAGIYASTDIRRGVHKAPANVGITGALGLEHRLIDSEQGRLNPAGVNALRILPGQGLPVVWGARTTSTDVTWQYINVRRLFLFLEESIQESLRGAVFEPNDLALWQRLKRTLTEFLTRVWQDGALFGASADEAFFVRIDDALNPPATRKQGLLYAEIGAQPVYPAEFIVVKIGIWDGGAQISE